MMGIKGTDAKGTLEGLLSADLGNVGHALAENVHWHFIAVFEAEFGGLIARALDRNTNIGYRKTMRAGEGRMTRGRGKDEH